MKHLLKEYGILTSFTIRHKITIEEFEKLYNEIKKTSNNKTDTEIQAEVQEILNKDKETNIPGVIPSTQKELRIQELLERSQLLAELIAKDDEIKKEEIIFLLNLIAKKLGVIVED